MAAKKTYAMLEAKPEYNGPEMIDFEKGHEASGKKLFNTTINRFSEGSVNSITGVVKEWKLGVNPNTKKETHKVKGTWS